ncbi:MULTISPECIES: DUF883 family protein [unclassified Undibacterium]|uniref:DUF883 family protein n=1 Tax=unclassified Undibacterium TaxID=2630295 RepID=UPI002AC9CD8A|nr:MULTISPECIES: DUF883 family protein [unclassified Undibacterium]MEB0137956.1 DUF883 family protein [Undibacterium sp. CCC2.1]MEB0173106.1 DUF883 family protein [Undibacterium sp. CCC1.1]MEB0174964.1 DUF883 family protein [Undibacterium sp. CCC3.4]MEB0216128.1 DUF883 family protein [Undibacterium sp. 5I2]WPX45407.1 DUF883 family protein [Undibacterium sp. CCC3.4]
MSSIEQHKDQLIQDFNQVISDAEDLLKNTEQQTGEGFKAAKLRFEKTLKTAKAEIQRMEEVVVRRGKEVVHATDDYVKENPWRSAGIAAGVGLLLGLLIGRNK